MTTSKYSRSEEKGESRSSRGVLLPAAGSSRRPQSGTILMLTQYRLKELLHYDSDTGIFTRKVGRGGMKVGSVAGTLHWTGYIRIAVDGRIYGAHRLAWLYIHGEFPPADTDHINLMRADNRIANLRQATQSENQQNMRISPKNTSGFRGVYWCKSRGRWCAAARMNYKTHRLGYFPTAEAAAEAYQAFARQHHGEFYLPQEVAK